MKVNIIFLDYLRHDFSDKVWATNSQNAGYPFDFVRIDRQGIAAAINEGIALSKDYDAIVTMANDILMPQDWLKKMVSAAEAIPQTGMAGIHCVEGVGEHCTLNGVDISISFTAFGNVLIPMKAIKEVGGFNTEYDPYGMQDADFAYRLNAKGYLNYYITGVKSEHIGHDVGNGTPYRKMKDEGLSKAPEIWTRLTKQYDESGNYTANMIEWPE